MISRTHLADAATVCARAEFAKWNAVLAHREDAVAALDRDADRTLMFRRMAVNAIALEIAQTLHVSEQQVWRMVEQGGRLRDLLPSVWSAFAEGIIDAQKASVLAVAVDRTKLSESRRSLDDVVVAYAATHTPAELRRWVDRLIDRLEPTDIDEAEAERARRHVRFDATHHGMSWVSGSISTIAAKAIFHRLAAAAKDLPDDGRTQEQKQADLFCSWLTNATGTECDIRAEVAVVVEATALAGVTDTPALVDGDSPIPPAWIFGLDASGSTLWTRLLTDPAGHVLDVTHLGYQPPQLLRRAAQWRDMVCRVNGCQRRALDCDLDHEVPFEENGPTSGRNLRSLCRRHHGIKGHGLMPADAYAPPEVHLVRLPSPSLMIDYIAA
ncbi:MAG: DUF222 domain-containing protein [Aeromicrobium sp.]